MASHGPAKIDSEDMGAQTRPRPAPRKLSLADFATQDSEEFRVGSPDDVHRYRRQGADRYLVTMYSETQKKAVSSLAKDAKQAAAGLTQQNAEFSEVDTSSDKIAPKGSSLNKL